MFINHEPSKNLLTWKGFKKGAIIVVSLIFLLFVVSKFFEYGRTREVLGIGERYGIPVKNVFDSRGIHSTLYLQDPKTNEMFHVGLGFCKFKSYLNRMMDNKMEIYMPYELVRYTNFYGLSTSEVSKEYKIDIRETFCHGKILIKR